MAIALRRHRRLDTVKGTGSLAPTMKPQNKSIAGLALPRHLETSLHTVCKRPWLRWPSFRSVAGLSAGCLLFIALGAPAAQPDTISTATLLNDMTDLAGMAEFPTPAYTCKQFSSYDRKAKSPTQDWFANGDCGQYLRVEERAGRKEFVMMDTDGPGAIVRIWSANPQGTLRVYLDGAAQPVLEAPMSELLGGKYPGLPQPIAGEYSKGWNLYFPIPYARHCKVTSDKGNFYYHVNYRTYPAGTPGRDLSCRTNHRIGQSDQTGRSHIGRATQLGADAGW